MELFVGQNIVKLSEVDSTNNYLRELLSKDEPLSEGTVIMAEHQTAGRGQQGTQWQSEKGMNLTFSVCLFPSFLPIQRQFDLNKAISLGIIDALTFVSPANYKLKWPNDIYLDQRKLGGILIENALKKGHIKHAVIGIGLNVNQTNFGGLDTATSLKKHHKKAFDLEFLVRKICECIQIRYEQLRNQNTQRLHKDYIHHLYRFDELAEFCSEGQVFKGKIVDVADNGELEILVDGAIRTFSLKTISFRPDPD